ncbi:MAG: hypothetical protein ACKVQQ_21240 [Burkholderiales bacterium]
MPTSSEAGVFPLDRQMTKCLELALDLEIDFADAMSVVSTKFSIDDNASFQPNTRDSFSFEPISLPVDADETCQLTNSLAFCDFLN